MERTTNAVCLQHVDFEGPGVFAEHLTRRGVELQRYLVPRDGLPSGPGDFLLVMGGPMSVNDPDSWIQEELVFLQQALERGVPVLGICLGSQLLARALGSEVHPGPALELGLTSLHVTEAGRTDPVFRLLPNPFLAFEWHGEIFDLPPGAVGLASSSLCPLQAFRYGRRVYGLLFHVEMDHRGIELLCRECPNDLRRGGTDPGTLLSQCAPHLADMHAWADRLLEHLLTPSD